MQIAVPSKGRPTGLKTLDLFPSAILYVPQNEKAAYLKTYQNVVGVPDSIKGITPTRNWILRNCNDGWVVMIDDDLSKQGWYELLPHKQAFHTLTEEEWIQEFVRLFDICDGMDFKIWGVGTDGDPGSHHPHRSILFQTYVTASCMGIINDGSYYFDERYTVKEDYEICLRHIRERGGILGVRHIFWKNSHWMDDGGCKDYRTQGVEDACIKMLIAEYGSLIRQVKKGGSEYSIRLDF